jgi:hypothetical protein
MEALVARRRCAGGCAISRSIRQTSALIDEIARFERPA